MNGFTQIPFVIDNLDVYIIRTSILSSINKALPNLKGCFLDAGCGKMPYKEYILSNSKVLKYIGLDIYNALEYDTNIKPDYEWDGITMPFEDQSFDTVMATEVLEHVPCIEVYLKEVYRVLKPDGIFFFTVPFLWNLHEVPNDEYRYTPFSLKRHLENTGFKSIDIQATGGWHAAMAQMLGLWVRRSSMSNIKRKYLSLFLKPIIRFLINKDKKAKVNFVNGQMITGLSGIIKK